MIKKLIILLALYLGFIHNVDAQLKSKKITLQSISSIGLLNGSKNTAVTLQTILGFNYRNTFLGVGTGLDYYRFRSIPLFADVRYEFNKGKRSPFLYGDLGYNYDWLENQQLQEANMYGQQNRFSGGLYYDAGVGYKFGFNKSDALLFSAGYSFKKLRSETGSGICPVTGPCYNAIQTYRYYFSRIVIKVGWRL